MLTGSILLLGGKTSPVCDNAGDLSPEPAPILNGVFLDNNLDLVLNWMSFKS